MWWIDLIVVEKTVRGQSDDRLGEKPKAALCARPDRNYSNFSSR